MAPGDKLDHSRDKLGIQGQSLMSSRSTDGSLSVPSSDVSPTGSRPSTATSGGQPDNAFGSISMPPEAVGVLETVIGMNKALEQQIDALRMRLTVEAKNHDTERSKIVHEKEKELNKKESEIGDLKDSLGRREERITDLERENRTKTVQIEQKEKEIGDLKALVQQTEEYTKELQKQMGKLKSDKRRSSKAGDEQEDDDISQLKQELVLMKDKINSMESELAKAKRVIEQQSGRMKHMEVEKVALSDKFKEELERAGKAMRNEVERMREVMKQQYMEMRNLREQNVEISSDVRDIKDLLLKNTIKPEPIVKVKTTERLDANFKSPRPIQKSPNYGMKTPLTSRPTATLKSNGNATVRSSVPSSLSKTGYGATKSTAALPSIQNSEHAAGRWIPSSTRQANLTKSAKTRRN